MRLSSRNFPICVPLEKKSALVVCPRYCMVYGQNAKDMKEKETTRIIPINTGVAYVLHPRTSNNKRLQEKFRSAAFCSDL